MMNQTDRSRATRRAGFTVLELMIAVTIVAVLASIGAYAYGRLSKRTRINQAITFFAAVGGAQATYFNLYGQYCGLINAGSPVNEGSYDPPSEDIKGGATNWDNPDPNWAICGVNIPTNTYFQYVMVAGGPNDQCQSPPAIPLPSGGTQTVPACQSLCDGGNSCAPGSYWYYIIGRADQDGDTFHSLFGSSSAMSDDHWSVEGIDLE